MNLSPIFSSSLVVATLLTGGAFADEAPLVLELSPTNALEYDSSSHQGLSEDVGAPADAPEETTFFDRNGVDPDISASGNGVGARQRIDFGAQQLPEDQINIQPYVELGAGIEAHDDNIISGGSGLGADTSASLGGGTTVSVNDQIDLNLGYTRKEDVSDGLRDGGGEDAVETGVSIKF